MQVSLKRTHDDDESVDEDEDDEEEVALLNEKDGSFKTPMDKDDYEGNVSPSRKLREPRSCTLKDNDGAILKQMLNYLLKNLQK